MVCHVFGEEDSLSVSVPLSAGNSTASSCYWVLTGDVILFLGERKVAIVWVWTQGGGEESSQHWGKRG